MPHEIFGDRFMGRRKPAWHHLGQVFDEPLTAVEAVQRCGADYRVQLRPCLTDYEGQIVNVPSRRVIVREPTHDDSTPRPFGVVSTSYELIQNIELAEILDPISRMWPVETVGVLHKGARVFITFDAGSGSIAGEETREFFLVVDSKDGTKELTVHYTPVRVVCQNTLTAGIQRASGSMSVRHVRGLRERAEQALRLMSDMRITRDRYTEALEALARRRITDAQVEAVLVRVYPDPSAGAHAALAAELGSNPDWLLEGDQRDLTNAKGKLELDLYRQQWNRREVTELFRRLNDEHSTIARTHFALFNAVAEHADHRESHGSPRVAAQSIVFGSRLDEKRRCYRALTELAS